MQNQTTQKLTGSDTGISRAAELLKQGQLVAFPTETVYGLGADARNDTAVARVFKAKNRPSFNPLIVHIDSIESARKIALFNPAANRLAAAFWPGPLTLVLPLSPDATIAPQASAGLPTIALRVPEHALAQKLLAHFGGPVAAPSANPSGKLSPTSAAHVIDGLQGRIAAVLDGGPCPVGLESTIIGFDPAPTLLRPGGLPAEAIQQCLGQALRLHSPQPKPNAPGQLSAHYAPNAALRLNATCGSTGGLHLGFGAVECDLNLSRAGDLTEAAANLFHHLRALDARNPETIAVSPIPDHGLGRAINDRLKRAATRA